ncbi:MAG: polymer-forming cytoskeletal protein [Patescibacteria group bacterium]
MKKTFWYGLALMALVIPLVSFSAEFRAGEQPSVAANERIQNDIYMSGGSVTSAGSVAGDIVAAGGSIFINGSVGADIIVVGGNITILSNVADDVRAAGGNIVIQGRVAGDVIAGGGQVTLGGPGVGKDVVIGGGSVRIDAPIGGSLRIGGGNIYINSPINGDITIDADKVTLGNAAVINGNITYKAREEMVKEDGAVVKGKVSFEPRVRKQISAALLVGLISIWVIGKFLALLLCALVIGLVFRRYSKEIIAKAVERPLLELGRGLVVFAALPALSALMFATVVGIPFGILGVVAFVALTLFAWIVTPIIIGSVAYRYFFKSELEISWKTILLGVFIFEVIGIVPLLGGLAQGLSMLIALGVIAAIKWRVAREWR